MTSASTKRRHARNKALVEQWRGWPTGLRVIVERDNGETLKTVTTCEAFLLDGAHAMIRVEGIPGNVKLGRVTTGWNPKASLGHVLKTHARKPLTTLRKGWKVRRAGNPRTEIGKARKAQVFEVAEVAGNPKRYTRALLRGNRQAFWTEAPEDWEMA